VLNLTSSLSPDPSGVLSLRSSPFRREPLFLGHPLLVPLLHFHRTPSSFFLRSSIFNCPPFYFLRHQIPPPPLALADGRCSALVNIVMHLTVARFPLFCSELPQPVRATAPFFCFCSFWSPFDPHLNWPMICLPDDPIISPECVRPALDSPS